MYKLVFASRLEAAEVFQDWVCEEEVLPSIRKTGGYDIQTLKNEFPIKEKSYQEQLALKEHSHQEELGKAMQDLTLKDNQLAIKDQALTLKDNQLAIKDQALTLRDQQLEKAQKTAVQLKSFIDKVNLRTKNEYIYIATCKQYASQNYFKIGSTTRLKKRISGYQTGRSMQDEYYYCYIKKVHCNSKIDAHIQHMLSDFREKNREIYNMHYEDLEDLMDLFCENFENSEEYYQDWVKNKLATSLAKTPVIPEALKVQDEKLVITNHFDERESSVNDLTKMSEDEMVTVLRERLDAFQGRERVSRKECLEVFDKKRSWFDLLKKHFGWKNSKARLDGYNFSVTY